MPALQYLMRIGKWEKSVFLKFFGIYSWNKNEILTKCSQMKKKLFFFWTFWIREIRIQFSSIYKELFGKIRRSRRKREDFVLQINNLTGESFLTSGLENTDWPDSGGRPSSPQDLTLVFSFVFQLYRGYWQRPVTFQRH